MILSDFNIPPLVPGKTPEETTVVVAMSGGVDSSCVAALCKEAGYKTIGITLQLWDYTGGTDSRGKKLGTCCALDDVYDARLVCKTIGIPHETLKIEAQFKEAVIDDFVDTYLAGATPIPCVRCNQRIKFDHLREYTQHLGADVLVTGHYARKVWVDGIPYIQQGEDAQKDQTYYLFTSTKEQISAINFPLGYTTKDVTRRLAKDLGLHLHQKAESFDICFVPGKDYRKVVKKFAPEAEKPGIIRHIDGHEIGQHDGIVGYTVGQRKGIGGGQGEPLYVIEIDAKTNKVIVGPKAALKKTTFTVNELNWVWPEQPNDLEVYAKIRAQHTPARATLSQLEPDRLQVDFHHPEEQISPGQAAVFYNEDGILLGGGFIEVPGAGKSGHKAGI